LFGLLSALSWGGGDFVGGLASRKTGAYRAVLYAEAIGLFALLCVGLFFREPLLPGYKILLAGFAGAIGSVGLLILYQAMITGQMSIATPVSALLAAALPVLVGAVTDGLPPWTKLAGFAAGLAAVWLVAQDDSGKTQLKRLSDLRLPVLSGICFGVYFVITHAATDTAVLGPMLASRTGGMLILTVFLLARRESWRVTSSAWPFIGVNAILDIGGNLFFILAGQAGRMDVAAVLSSLYPGATVLLAWLLLKEKINRLQWLGILAALLTIGLMTV